MIVIKQHASVASFILASVVAAYPDEQYSENVNLLLGDPQIDLGFDKTAKSFKILRSILIDTVKDKELLDDLRSEYIDRFDRGKEVCSLYETEYGRERAMVKGNELGDIAGFYKAFGLETGGDGVQAEMIDHVAVELEFYALLLMKATALIEAGDEEGVEIVLDARRKFLKDHLARFIGAIGERNGVKASQFYSKVFDFCNDLVMEECEKLGVEVEKVQWLYSQAERPDELSCGAAGACVK